MSRGLFAKKSISALVAEATDSKHALKRTLGPLNLTTMGVGAIIGAGFFVLTGQAAAVNAGPAVLLSFAIAALICFFSALCYAEFASLIPIAGSAYSYAYATMGEFAAWSIGWGLTLEYLFSAATVSVGWSAYFVSLLRDIGIRIPEQFCNAPLAYDDVLGWVASGNILNVPAMLITAVIGYMISVGIQTAAIVNNLLVIIKMGVILLFIACGVAYINWDHLHPFIPENTGVFGHFGWSGILRGAGIVFFAFIGFDAVSTLAQESRNPQKDMPIGMLGSLGISTFTYIIVAVVLLGVVGYSQLNVPDPMAVAVNALGPNFVWLRYIIKIAIIIGLCSVILVMMLGQTRIFYTMAQDGLLPKVFGKTHPKFKTPMFTSILITMVAIVITGLFPVGILGQVTNMGALLAFMIVCLGIWVLRRKQPHLHRPFKTPWVPFIPIIGALSCLVLMLALAWVTWVQLILWMAIGYMVYFLYGVKHSLVRNPK
ncbi:MAG: amino acid permease [Simkania sp.]|nr:amino acid permease [Simkania sp.]